MDVDADADADVDVGCGCGCGCGMRMWDADVDVDVVDKQPTLAQIYVCFLRLPFAHLVFGLKPNGQSQLSMAIESKFL